MLVKHPHVLVLSLLWRCRCDLVEHLLNLYIVNGGNLPLSLTDWHSDHFFVLQKHQITDFLFCCFPFVICLNLIDLVLHLALEGVEGRHHLGDHYLFNCCLDVWVVSELSLLGVLVVVVLHVLRPLLELVPERH